ncbi:hypothetical protein J5X84_25525 [Streptosporangiaceae bacterium NEAU-GS5]|nr:hypothetical protein [Streptosporangiaceae bacterium NEAU-GS5]
MGWVSGLTAIATAVEALCLLLAGLWAYLKFSKGRTFRSRLEISVSASGHELRGRHYLKVTVRLVNIGHAKLRFREHRLVRLWCAHDIAWTAETPADNGDHAQGPRNIEWLDTGLLTPIFQEHVLVEPGEPLAEDLLIPVPPPAKGTHWAAYKVEMTVCGMESSLRRDWSALRQPVSNFPAVLPRRSNCWHTSCIAVESQPRRVLGNVLA